MDDAVPSSEHLEVCKLLVDGRAVAEFVVLDFIMRACEWASATDAKSMRFYRSMNDTMDCLPSFRKLASGR